MVYFSLNLEKQFFAVRKLQGGFFWGGGGAYMLNFVFDLSCNDMALVHCLKQ